MLRRFDEYTGDTHTTWKIYAALRAFRIAVKERLRLTRGCDDCGENVLACRCGGGG